MKNNQVVALIGSIEDILLSFGLPFLERLNLSAAEVDSIAAETLTRAAEKYDVTKGAKFKTYYRRALYNELRKATAQKWRLQKLTAAEFESAKNDIEKVLSCDSITGKFKYIIRATTGSKLKFTENEARYINLFGHVQKVPTDKQAADLLQVSEKTIYNIRQRLKGKLEPVRMAYRNDTAGELICQYYNKVTGEQMQDPTAEEVIRRNQ
jgi:DNA-directed RNA polymerase sigma subunit (sigma70/sigma32)